MPIVQSPAGKNTPAQNQVQSVRRVYFYKKHAR